MTRARYDVIVIGGGPAGATAAYHAACGGLRVLVVDKAPFPRPKTCGDSLSPRALAVLDRMNLTELTGYPITAIRAIHVPSGCGHDVDAGLGSGSYCGRTVVRTVLDDAVLQKARAAGAEQLVGCARAVIRSATGRVTGVMVESERGRVRLETRHVVCATGALGAAALAGYRTQSKRTIAVAARTYGLLGRHAGNAVEMYVPPAPSLRRPLGYSWVFPVGPTRVNVGAGYVFDDDARGKKPRAVLAAFVDWLIRHDPRFAAVEAWTPPDVAVVPLGPVTLGEPGLLLVGDAAGLANPLSAEGIATAMESGESAGRALAADEARALETYREDIESRHGRALRIKGAFSDVYGSPELLVGRGADVLVAPHRTVGRAVCRAILDLGQPAPPPLNADDPIAAEIAAVRARMAVLVEGCGPLLRELVDELWCMPEIGLGRATFLAAAVWAGSEAIPQPLPSLRRDVVTVIETLTLIAAVQKDLTLDATGACWGRTTHAMLLADTLNAGVLSLMCALPTRWILDLSSAARLLFQADWRASVEGRLLELEEAYARLYRLAALAGAAAGVTSTLQDGVAEVARFLAASNAGQGDAMRRLASRAMRETAGLADPLRRRMACLIGAVMPVAAPSAGSDLGPGCADSHAARASAG